MGKYVQGFDVNQMSFLPLSFDEMIDEDNAVGTAQFGDGAVFVTFFVCLSTN